MKATTHKISSAISVILGIFGGFSNAAFPQTAEEVAMKHLDAIGGAVRIKAIISAKTESLVAGDGITGEIERTVYAKRPNKLRVEYSFPQALVIMAYNGEVGWAQAILPNGQKKAPSILSPEKTHSFLEEFGDAFNDNLLNHKEKGYNISLAGRSEIMGREAYMIEIATADGSRETRFIDATNFLEIERRKTNPQSHSLAEMIFSDFRTLGGITSPYNIKVTLDGKSQLVTSIVKETTNYPMDDAIFEVPK